MKQFSTLEVILAADLVTDGTLAVAYPTGKTAGNFVGGESHVIAELNGGTYTSPKDFTIAFGAATATITWKHTGTLKAGRTLFVQLDEPGDDAGPAEAAAKASALGQVLPAVWVELGSPITSDDDSVSVNQAVGGAGNLTITGARASGGVATLDVARNLIITSAGNDSGITFTVTGTDIKGRTMKETITGANAGVAAGKKAFKTVTQVAASGAAAGNVKVGHGDVLGLPFYLRATAQVLVHTQDGAAAGTPGTLVAGATAVPSATSADPFGTVDPNAACDGTKGFGLIVLVTDPDYLPPTYAG